MAVPKLYLLEQNGALKRQADLHLFSFSFSLSFHQTMSLLDGALTIRMGCSLPVSLLLPVGRLGIHNHTQCGVI